MLREAHGERRGVSRAELVELGRRFLHLRWWPNHHPKLSRIAREAGNALAVPMQAARALALEGAAVGFFPELLIGEDIARGALVE